MSCTQIFHRNNYSLSILNQALNDDSGSWWWWVNVTGRFQPAIFLFIECICHVHCEDQFRGDLQRVDPASKKKKAIRHFSQSMIRQYFIVIINDAENKLRFRSNDFNGFQLPRFCSLLQELCSLPLSD